MWLFFVMLIIHMVLFGNAQPTNATNVTSIAQSTPNGDLANSSHIVLMFKILSGIISALGSFSAVWVYFKYNSTRQVAVGLIEAGKENFNIEKSSCKTYPCCWSFIMLLSSIRCCCCAKDCCCSCDRKSETRDENFPLNSLATSDSTTNNESFTTTKTVSRRSSHHIALGYLVETEQESPTQKWASEASINLPEEARKTFNQMLNNCIGITNSNFLQHFQHYASFSLNRHSSYCRHPSCIEENHAEFTDYCCSRDSIFYYGVLDWNHLRKITPAKQSENKPLDAKMLWTMLFHNRRYLDGEASKKEWKFLQKSSNNLCLTLINFPLQIHDTSDEAHWSKSDRKLALVVMDFMYKLKMKVVYAVRRSDENRNPTYEPVWQVEEVENDDSSVVCFTLTISKHDLVTFPKGENIPMDKAVQRDCFDADRVFFDEDQPIEKSRWEPVVENSSDCHKLQMTVKFNRSSAESGKLFCRICLGDKKNSQSLDRFDKPYLESPPLYPRGPSKLPPSPAMHLNPSLRKPKAPPTENSDSEQAAEVDTFDKLIKIKPNAARQISKVQCELTEKEEIFNNIQLPSKMGLIDAIKAKNVIRVKELVQAGCDINVEEPRYQESALFLAISSKSNEIFDILLSGEKAQKTIIINKKNAINENTPLHESILRRNDYAVTQLCLCEGIDVNPTDYTAGDTPLHLAVAKGYVLAVFALSMHYNINFGIKNKNNLTPLEVNMGNSESTKARHFLKKCIEARMGIDWKENIPSLIDTLETMVGIDLRETEYSVLIKRINHNFVNINNVSKVGSISVGNKVTNITGDQINHNRDPVSKPMQKQVEKNQTTVNMDNVKDVGRISIGNEETNIGGNQINHNGPACKF